MADPAGGRARARSTSAPTLPSFLLLPTELEVAPEALALPWADRASSRSATLARERGAELPHRLVSSAKSWLCHGGVDRTAAVLPWRGAAAEQELAADGGAEGARVSPVEASARYLEHLRAAWDQRTPGRAAGRAGGAPDRAGVVRRGGARADRDRRAPGRPRRTLTLLEEPQAAFYSWLARAGDQLAQAACASATSSWSCDVGGGTTDFSLIAVSEQGGDLALERVAVGDHILLGGDNMDLALAHAVSQRVAEAGKKLDALRSSARWSTPAARPRRRCSAPSAPEQVPVAILGRGRKLIGGTHQDRARRAPRSSDCWSTASSPRSRPTRAPRAQRALGLRELGLPYATDPAITRHLAELPGPARPRARPRCCSTAA